MNHYCHHPWSGLDIAPDGTLQPCCKFIADNEPGWPTFNISAGIEKYQESTELRRFQQKFINNVKPASCNRCWKDEDAGLLSKRQLDFNRFPTVHIDSDIKFITLPMGNLCNLKCRICSADSSTTWIKEWNDLYKKKYSTQQWHKDPMVWNDIIEKSKTALELHIHGGEPFLHDSREHLQLLTTLRESGHSKDIRIHYSTNGTIYPKNEYWELWKMFNSVDIQCSIDDYGKRFEYNRHPAKWSNVKQNLLRYKQDIDKEQNLQFSISTTVSAFTIFYLDEFVRHITELGLPMPWLGRLNTPVYYKNSIFPDSVKNIIEARLRQSTFKDVNATVEWLTDTDSDIVGFVKHVNLHDKYRNESFKMVFPELYELLIDYFNN